MNGGIVPIIIVLVLVFSSAIKRLLERMQEQMGSEVDAPEGFEASPEEIRDFLASLQSGHQRRAQAGPAMSRVPDDVLPMSPEVRPRLMRGPAEEELLLPMQEPMQAEDRPAGVVAPPRVEEQAERRATRPTRRRRPRRTERKKPVVATEVQKAAAVTPLALRGMDLRKAIVWSEILGKPVSLRGGGPPLRRDGLGGR